MEPVVETAAEAKSELSLSDQIERLGEALTWIKGWELEISCGKKLLALQKESVAEVEATIDDLQNYFDRIDRERSGIIDVFKTTNLLNLVKEQAERIKELEEEKESDRERIDALEHELSDLMSACDDMESEISSAISEIESGISELQSAQSSVEMVVRSARRVYNNN